MSYISLSWIQLIRGSPGLVTPWPLFNDFSTFYQMSRPLCVIPFVIHFVTYTYVCIYFFQFWWLFFVMFFTRIVQLVIFFSITFFYSSPYSRTIPLHRVVRTKPDGSCLTERLWNVIIYSTCLSTFICDDVHSSNEPLWFQWVFFIYTHTHVIFVFLYLSRYTC